ncbi:FHA domain-containing protein [Brachybacterium huguangmaarense]|uniref:FHA domain-containing protein n=1 Tax=Brachybacterium huguangmaarense TaxID=1652028 RepID=A0ABY6FYW0_9MICO|nr:FHA domain-containing protein [Brachybacterium huguangmaarense]UYG15619.1 FHA domain-containing protein [Brachybacterium huguangmaarense]
MSESRPLLPPGTWYQPGPAYLIRRADSFVVLTPTAPKPLLDAAWAVLGHGPASDDLLETLAREAGLEGADALGAVLFGTLGGDSTLLGVKGDTPLAAYTHDGRELVAAEDGPALARREGVLRLAFGDLPTEQGPGVLTLESGMVRIRGFVHMTEAAGRLDDAARDALAALVEQDGRSIEDPEVRRRREQNPPPARAPRTPPPAPARPAPAAPLVVPAAAPSAPDAPEPAVPNIFADLLGEPAPAAPPAPAAATTAPAPESARTTAPPPSVPPSAAPSAPGSQEPPDASPPEPARPAPVTPGVAGRDAPRRPSQRSSLFDRAAGSSAGRSAPRPVAPAAPQHASIASSLELTRDPSTLEFSPDEPEPEAGAPSQTPAAPPTAPARPTGPEAGPPAMPPGPQRSTEHSTPAPPPAARPSPAPAPAPAAPEADPVAPEPPAVSPPASPEAGPAATGPAADDPREESRSYDDLFGHTLHRRIEDAARPRHAEEPPPVAPVAPAPGPPAAPGAARPEPDRAAPPPAPAPVSEVPAAEFIDWVPGVRRETSPPPPLATPAAPAAAPPQGVAPAAPAVPSSAASSPGPSHSPAAPSSGPSPSSSSGPPAPAPVPSPGRPAGSAGPIQQPMTAPRAAVTVPALVCPAGHASPPDRDTCRVCGTHVGGPVRTVVRPPLGRLEISTGGTVTLDRTVVLGRRPRASRVGGDDVPLLVTVPSPQQDVSRSHLQIRPEGWHAVATDLATTNGTLLVRSQHETVRLRPHEAVVLVDGDVLDLGDGVVLRWSEQA